MGLGLSKLYTHLHTFKSLTAIHTCRECSITSKQLLPSITTVTAPRCYQSTVYINFRGSSVLYQLNHHSLLPLNSPTTTSLYTHTENHVPHSKTVITIHGSHTPLLPPGKTHIGNGRIIQFGSQLGSDKFLCTHASCAPHHERNLMF